MSAGTCCEDHLGAVFVSRGAEPREYTCDAHGWRGATHLDALEHLAKANPGARDWEAVRRHAT